jgi:hypothetical protein
LRSRRRGSCGIPKQRIEGERKEEVELASAAREEKKKRKNKTPKKKKTSLFSPFFTARTSIPSISSPGM